MVLKPMPNLPSFLKYNPLRFLAHADHRIVMALAPLSLKIGQVTFDTPEIVAKSYPDFWVKIAKIVPNFQV